MIYRIIARLLDYPDQELWENLSALHDTVVQDDEINGKDQEEIISVINQLKDLSLVDAQAEYVKTFDMVPEHSLHLTHHLFGDDKGRGPALIDLCEYYRSNGLEIDANELPDYLPLILEYVSTVDELQARVFLADAVKVITVIANNLEKAQSVYAPLLNIIEKRGHLAGVAA